MEKTLRLPNIKDLWKINKLFLTLFKIFILNK